MGVVLVCRRDVRVGPGQGRCERPEGMASPSEEPRPCSLTPRRSHSGSDHSEDEDHDRPVPHAQRVLFVAHTVREDRLRSHAAAGDPPEQAQYEEELDEAPPDELRPETIRAP